MEGRKGDDGKEGKCREQEYAELRVLSETRLCGRVCVCVGIVWRGSLTI